MFGTRNAAAHPIFQCLEVADPRMEFIRILSIIILGLLCVGCVSSQQPSQILADRAYARSVELLSAGQQSAAEDLIEQALESNPDYASLLFAKGVLDRSRWLKHEAMYSFDQQYFPRGKLDGSGAFFPLSGLEIKSGRFNQISVYQLLKTVVE